MRLAAVVLASDENLGVGRLAVEERNLGPGLAVDGEADGAGPARALGQIGDRRLGEGEVLADLGGVAAAQDLLGHRLAAGDRQGVVQHLQRRGQGRRELGDGPELDLVVAGRTGGSDEAQAAVVLHQHLGARGGGEGRASGGDQGGGRAGPGSVGLV